MKKDITEASPGSSTASGPCARHAVSMRINGVKVTVNDPPKTESELEAFIKKLESQK